MIYIVLLMLTFSDGSFVQKEGMTANSIAECAAIIEVWKDEMHAKYADQTEPLPSTFITGCIEEQSS